MKKTGRKKQFCKRGHDTFVTGRNKHGQCIPCIKVYDKEHHKKYYELNKNEILKKQKERKLLRRDELVEYLREYYKAHKEEARLWGIKYREENKEEIKIKKHNYYEAHKDELLEYYKNHREEFDAKDRKYRKAHPEVYLTNNIKNQTNRSLRIVAWTDWDKIKKIYKKCPKNKEVDHIVPLQGDLVSGLHVSWNLQYLTSKQNRTKRNKVDLVQISKQYGRLLEKLGLKEKQKK